MIHYVKVGVALSRPPKIDEWRRYCVVAANAHEAELIAQQMAACTSVMPVASEWESSHHAGPVQPFGALGCMCWCVEWSDDIGDGIDGWQIHGRCPYHGSPGGAPADSEGAATEPAECPPGVHSTFDFCPGRAICEDGWEEPVDHGIRSAECEAGTCDCDGAVPQADEWGDDFIPPTADRLMEVQGVMGSIAGDPPTPETANAGGPDTDDTPVIAVCTRLDHRCATPEAGPCNGWPRTKTYDYATGAIVPDERFKMIGEHGPELPWRGPRKITLKVCPCGDTSHAPDACRYATGAIVPDGLKRKPPALDVPHVCETSRCWQECRNRTEAAKPSTLSPGRVECTRCDDWACNYGGPGQGTAADAFIALRHHRCNVITEGGLTECSSLSQRRPTSIWERLFRAAMRLLPSVD